MRGIHLAFHARGAAPTLARRPERDDPELILTWRAYAALDRRAAAARSAIDTSEPQALAAALLALSPRGLDLAEQLLAEERVVEGIIAASLGPRRFKALARDLDMLPRVLDR